SLDQQLAQANDSSGPGAPYAVLRQMNLLQQQNKLDDALAVGRLQFGRAPDLALAFALAQIEHTQDRDTYAKNYLTWAATPGPVNRGEEGILAEMARWAVERGDRELALDLYAKALAAPNMTNEFLQAVLPEALTLAQDASNNDLHDRWQKQWDVLNPPKAN
ncbi:MAG TPA: hypothetical protein VK737_07275, partial [Opitutales bacterium]|nr:hypothetical protein [Opitutales bacterium]